MLRSESNKIIALLRQQLGLACRKHEQSELDASNHQATCRDLTAQIKELQLSLSQERLNSQGLKQRLAQHERFKELTAPRHTISSSLKTRSKSSSDPTTTKDQISTAHSLDLKNLTGEMFIKDLPKVNPPVLTQMSLFAEVD